VVRSIIDPTDRADTRRSREAALERAVALVERQRRREENDRLRLRVPAQASHRPSRVGPTVTRVPPAP
jgi:hypothetical protein